MPHAPTRRLQDLISVGPAMLRDFELLKVRSATHLARQDPRKMYENLCRITGRRIDVCCLDTFQAAVAQARDPLLPAEKCQWWDWGRSAEGRKTTKKRA